jgi:hypothetical protein
MSVRNGRKLNRLVLNWPKGAVYTSEWMTGQGFRRSLIDKYKKSKWLSPIARGAYILSGDRVDWTGGLYAIQNQLKLNIHVGGKTALQIKGLAHYLPAEIKKIYLFGTAGQKLPSWFKDHNWNVTFDYTMTNLFKENIGLTDQDYGSFTIKISSPERAIMETLYLVPHKQTFEEGSLLMEHLVTLRPDLVRELLEDSKSIKVKRLFLYLAERHNHPWLEHSDLSKVDLGSGKRVIVPGGVFDKKYLITVPKY